MSQLVMERVTSACRMLHRIKSLYDEAFPREERAPFFLLKAAAKKPYIDFFAFYNRGDFCGFAYLVSGEQMCTLMYLAVEEKYRSCGYGGQILSCLRAYCGQRVIALDIEQVSPQADNYEQRRRRRAFYLRNGFSSSGYGHLLRGVQYEILISSGTFCPEEYAALIHSFSHGMLRIELQKLAIPEPTPGPEGTSIRAVRAGDLEQLLQLYLYLHECSVPPASERRGQIWDKICSDPDYHILVAEQAGRIVSSCTCIIIPNLTRGLRPYALIENVVTDEAYRGRGLASACLAEAVALAEQAGAYKVMLLTGAKDQKTLDFYSRAGFNCRDKTAFIRWL